MNIHTLEKLGIRITIKHAFSSMTIYVSQTKENEIESSTICFHLTKIYKRAWYKKIYIELCSNFNSIEIFNKHQIYNLLISFKKDLILYEGI